MRPALAALIRQQQVVDNQARHIAALEAAVQTIAGAAGMERHPVMAQLRRLAMQSQADAENPAQPIADPAPEAATTTREQEQEATAEDEPTSSGASPLTDTEPDTTTTPTEIGGVTSGRISLAEIEDKDVAEKNVDHQDPTKPVAGTEELPPREDVVTRADVQYAKPTNEIDQPLSGDFAKKPTKPTMASESRGFAALRLARLRMEAGIAEGDDIAIAGEISGSDLNDAAIASEIATLSKVVASRPANASNSSRVSRTASQQRRVPSVATAASTPSIAPASQAVSADEFLW
jgi:hypothetical protein